MHAHVLKHVIKTEAKIIQMRYFAIVKLRINAS